MMDEKLAHKVSQHLQPYDPKMYRAEIALGLRRQNGAMKLKRLTGRHVRILVLHLSGMTALDIAEGLGINHITISKIINDPLGQAFLQAKYADLDHSFDALYGDALDVIRDGLSPATKMGHRLKAADMFLKRKDGKERGTEETAEDVIQQILANVNIQVNVNNGGR